MTEKEEKKSDSQGEKNEREKRIWSKKGDKQQQIGATWASKTYIYTSWRHSQLEQKYGWKFCFVFILKTDHALQAADVMVSLKVSKAWENTHHLHYLHKNNNILQ